MEEVGRSGSRLDRVNEHLRGLERGINGVIGTGAKLGLMVDGIRAVGDAISASREQIASFVTAASNLSESTNKVEVVFGSAADSIKAFASTADVNLGLSQQAALEAAGTFGNLFTAMGFGRGAAADMSKNLLSLAADLASFNNISVDEALIKLRAGLVGETEPLRTVGVNLNQAEIEIEAVRLGLISQGQELTAAGKAAAAYSLIFQQTSTAQGDFARTASGLANSQRILQAGFNDLKASAGEALLPLATDSVQAMNAFIAQVKRAQGEGFNVLDASLVATAASIRTNFGPDAARSFEAVTAAIGRMAEAAGKGDPKGFFQGIGDVGEDIGREVKEKWLPAFLEWAEPAKDATGKALGELWSDQMKPWIESTGELLGTTAKEEWIPAFNKWAEGDGKKALRPGLDAMATDAKAWAKSEGSQLMRDVGGAMAWALLDGFDAGVHGLKDEIAAALQNQSTQALNDYRARLDEDIKKLEAGPQPLGPGGKAASSFPRIGGEPFIGPIEGPRIQFRAGQRTPAEQAILDEVAQVNEAARLLREAQQEAGDVVNEPLPEPSTAGTPRPTPTPPRGEGDPLFGRDKPDDKVKKARTAIDGFIAELAKDGIRIENAVGEMGAKVWDRFADALESNSESAGRAVASGLQDLRREAERLGLENALPMAEALAGSFHNALIDRGNPALRAAAFENLKAYTDAIKAAGALTPESFARVLNIEALKERLGSGGRQIFASFDIAIKEGGARNIESLAQAALGMRRTLLEDRDLSPERAKEIWDQIMAAVNTAIEDGTAEARQNLQDFLAETNFTTAEEKIGNILAKKIDDAAKQLTESEQRAIDQATTQIQRATEQLQESRNLRAARENVTDTQRQELKDTTDEIERQRQAYRDLRDEQHNQAQQAREDSELARSRAQEDAEIARKLKEARQGVNASLGGGAPVGSQLNPTAGIGRIAPDAGLEARRAAEELARRRALEDANTAHQRELQAQDRQTALQERGEDFQKERDFQDQLDGFRRTQAQNLQTFLDAQEDAAHQRQINRTNDERDAQIAAARAAQAEKDQLAEKEFREAIERNRLLNEVQGGAKSGEDANQAFIDFRKGQENAPKPKASDFQDLPQFDINNPLQRIPTTPLPDTGPKNGPNGPSGPTKQGNPTGPGFVYNQYGPVIGVPGGIDTILDALDERQIEKMRGGQ